MHLRAQLCLLVVLPSLSAAAFVACGSETIASDGGVSDASVSDARAPTDSSVQPAADAPAEASSTCALGNGKTGTRCGTTCVDLASDLLNCGTCAKACSPGSICQSGCVDVAGSLQGLRWNLPCIAPNSDTVCGTNPPTTLSATLKGDANVTYAVTLRLRGIVEQKTYAGNSSPDGGVAEGGMNSSFFTVDGLPASDDWNIYKLTVSDPALTAYVNSGQSAHYYVDPIDYTVTISMKGGATVTLLADPVDVSHYEIKNVSLADGGPIVVPGVPPAPNPFDGQFVQMDVVSVVPR